MKKSLHLLLLLTMVSVVSLYAAVQSKRVLVGIYKSEEALTEAKQLLRTDPPLVKVKRDHGFETVSRMQGSKRILYLETFSKTKDLLSTFVIVSRKFPDAFIEEYMDSSTNLPDPVMESRVEPRSIPVQEPVQMSAPAPVMAATAISGFDGFEAVSDVSDDDGVLWERVSIDENGKAQDTENSFFGAEEIETPASASIAKPVDQGMPGVKVATPKKEVIKKPTPLPASNDEEWNLDFMREPALKENSSEKPVETVKKEPVPIVAKKPIVREEKSIPVEKVQDEVIPAEMETVAVNDEYRRDEQSSESVLDEVHEIKLVLDTKTILILVVAIIILFWLFTRKKRPKRSESEYNDDNSYDDLVAQSDAHSDLVDLLIKKKSPQAAPVAQAAPAKGFVDIFSHGEDDVSPEWELKSSPKVKKKPSDKKFPLIVDIHSHMIPGIDDGSKSMKESVAMVRQLHALGYKKVITTPHIMSHRYPNSSKIILDGLAKLREELSRQGVDIVVEAAAEYYLDEHLRSLVAKKEILTFGKNCLLFELSYNVKPINLERWIALMQEAGYQPVLAHPERYQYMRRDFNIYQQLKDMGVYLQVNINSLNGFYAPEAKQTALKLANKGMIDFLGSDAHAIRHLQALSKTVKTELFAKIVQTNKIKNNTLLT